MFLFSRKSRGGQWTIKLNMNYEGNEAPGQAGSTGKIFSRTGKLLIFMTTFCSLYQDVLTWRFEIIFVIHIFERKGEDKLDIGKI